MSIKIKQKIVQSIKNLRKVPLKLTIPIGIVFIYLTSSLVTFLQEKPVQFSYAATTCAKQLTLLPGLTKLTADADFIVTTDKTFQIGKVRVVSLQTCFTPKKAPSIGTTKVSVAPFGGWFAKKTFALSIPKPPIAYTESLTTPVPLAKPLAITLSGGDKVYQYQLEVETKAANCPLKDSTVYCDIASLGLVQGQSYAINLVRLFDDKKIATVAKDTIKILTATSLVNASVGEGQVIYEKPKSFAFEFDKDIVSAEIALTKIEGDTRTEVASTATFDKKLATLSVEQELDRDMNYEISITNLQASDGSTLASPYKLNFKLSGGPKVTGVSVGGAGVAQNTQITVTFDQPIKADVDITKFASSTGVAMSVRRTSDRTVAFTVASAPLCASFSLTVNKGLISGSNGGVSTELWKFDSRIVCGSSAGIGYSAQGRTIIAYTFGSGDATILFTGGMHGNEPSGVTTMQAWVTYLQSNAYKIPAGKKIVIVPNTNPDGIATGMRNNVNNVNIDRNFPASNWRPDIDTASGTLPTGGGTSPGSEPETIALMALTRQLRPILEVSFHAQGSLVGANQSGNSVTVGAAYARTVGYGTMFGNAEDVMGYSITGEYEDWMAQEMGIPAILIELPRVSGNYFNSQLNALLNLLNV